MLHVQGFKKITLLGLFCCSLQWSQLPLVLLTPDSDYKISIYIYANLMLSYPLVILCVLPFRQQQSRRLLSSPAVEQGEAANNKWPQLDVVLTIKAAVSSVLFHCTCYVGLQGPHFFFLWKGWWTACFVHWDSDGFVPCFCKHFMRAEFVGITEINQLTAFFILHPLGVHPFQWFNRTK